MSLLDKVTKVVAREAASLVRSQVRSSIKKKATSYFGKMFAKSEEELADEAAEIIGFPTTNFKVEKNKVVFKNSSALAREWLLNSPVTRDKLVRDEETGKVYFNNLPIDNNTIAELVKEYTKITNIKSTAITGSITQALKTLDPQDLTARNFGNDFGGWKVGSPSVIDTFLVNAFGEGIETDMDYAQMLFRKWIIGTAGRAIEPGSSLDGCLTFQGPPGVGKTRFFRNLLPPPYDKRTGEIMCDNIKNPQKFVEAIVGKTVACFDELSVLTNPGVEDTFKQLLSSQHVDVRLAWRRDPQRYELRQGFGATSNPLQFIRDPALCRRLWVIKLNDKKRLNFDWLRANRTALWQEAVYLAKIGAPAYLSYEEQKQVESYNSQFMVS